MQLTLVESHKLRQWQNSASILVYSLSESTVAKLNVCCVLLAWLFVLHEVLKDADSCASYSALESRLLCERSSEEVA